MALPFYYHIGNTGGLSFMGACGAYGARDHVLDVNSAEDLDRQLHKLAPDHVAKLTFAGGHAVYLAEPHIPDRYEITMLRWPLAVFCADAVYHHETPECAASLPDVFTIADPHERLRAQLDHRARGAHAPLPTLLQWMIRRHKLAHDPLPGTSGHAALVESCDTLFQHAYDLVGITELMDETLFLFQDAFPERKIAPWIRVRLSKKRIDPFNLPADIVARFDRDFAADIALYDRARARLLARFAALWRARPDLGDRYIAYKTAMILTDPLLMARFAEGSALFFPPELPLEELRASVAANLPRAREIRAQVLRAS